MKRPDVPKGSRPPPCQDRTLNGSGTELSNGGIDRTFGLTPAILRVSQLRLPMGIGGGDQALDANPDPSYPGSVEPEPLVKGQRV